VENLGREKEKLERVWRETEAKLVREKQELMEKNLKISQELMIQVERHKHQTVLQS